MDSIILVSFGAKDKESFNKCLLPFKKEALGRYKNNIKVEIAFTNKERVEALRTDGVEVKGLKETIDSFIKEGKKEILVQPLYLIQGLEYKNISNICREYKEITLGKSLLSLDKEGNINNLDKIVDALEGIKGEKEGLVLIGHGAKGRNNLAYELLEKEFRKRDNKIYLINFISGISMEKTLEKIKKDKVKFVQVLPFLIVLGYHFNKDIIGEENGILKIIEKEGIKANLNSRALGEIDRIRELVLQL